ncbi:MAG TPA: 4'-phosphopantetheinyl transferase superfamily protein [Acidimicrobiia bacterium]|nr:4'-phosphopantetheinyl transferase superfamily protein [Acidimicrobiia bacterium]
MPDGRSDAPSSLSHHRDWLAIGVSSAERLGVDVLAVPSNADFVNDTALVLSATEIEWIRAHSADLRGVAFAECWTRKEAYAKWRGTGLTADLRCLTLTPVSDDATVVFWTARVADAFVTVASDGPEPPDVRIHHR